MQTALFTATVTPAAPPAARAAALLDDAGPLEGVHALVLAEPGLASLDLLCGLIGRGCGAAAELPPGGPVPAVSAELVLAPQIDSLDSASRAILLTRRCLLPCGRIVLHSITSEMAPQIARLLRAAGFSDVRVRAQTEGATIRADWPMFGHAMRSAGRA